MHNQKLFLLATVELVNLAQVFAFTKTAGQNNVNGINQFKTREVASPVATISKYEELADNVSKLYLKDKEGINFKNEDNVYFKRNYRDVKEISPEEIINENFSTTENLKHRSKSSANTKHFRDFLEIRKCCSWGQEFAHNSTECVPRLEKQDNAEEEILYPPMDENVSYWVPPSLRSTPLNITYSQINRKYDFNVTVEASPSFVNRFLQIDNTHHIFVLEMFNEIAEGLWVTKQEYCFEKEQNSSYPFVIFTAINVAKINKCCRKGQQLDSQFSYCILRPNQKEEQTEWEIIHSRSNITELYWVPFVSERKKLVAKYFSRSYHFRIGSLVFKVDAWTNITYNYDGILQFTPKRYKRSVIENRPLLLGPNYCVDAVESGVFAPYVLVAPSHLAKVVTKCCLPDQMLSKNGYCESMNGMIKDKWSIGTAKDSNSPDYFISFLPATCLNNFFKTRSIELGKSTPPKKSYSLDEYCIDSQITSTGSRKVMGTCTIPPNVGAYERTRPLGAVTAAVLAAAAVATVARADTRRTTHGRALACHALCLCACSALQVAWFLKPKFFPQKECREYAYPIYFFMVAANFWLFCITLNIYLGFTRPLEALLPQPSGDVWKQFALLSCVAWGGAAVLTAISIALHSNDDQRIAVSFISSSFAETRLCYIEYPRGKVHLGTILYYFVPMSLLVALNTIFILCTAVNMRKLKKDASFVHAVHKGTQSSSIQSALVYVRLLLLAGVLEMTVELLAWTTRDRRQHQVESYALLFDLKNYYNYVIAVTLLDCLRALGVLWMCVGPAAHGWFLSCWKVLLLLGQRLRRLIIVAPQETTSSRDLEMHLRSI